MDLPEACQACSEGGLSRLVAPSPKYDPVEHGALCHECPLNGRTVVPPSGAEDPELVIVGEGPGEQEVRQGRPFVGPSGKKLDELLREAGGIRRSQVWISNAVLCRAEVPNLKTKARFEVKNYIAWLQAENKRRRKEAKETGGVLRLLKSPFTCCKPRLRRELKRAEIAAAARGQPNGAIIVPLGNFAMKVVTGLVGVMKYRGSPLNTDYLENDE